MGKLALELPDKVSAEIKHYVDDGWFASETELIRAAIHDFLRRNPTDLLERFQRDDIAWATSQAKQNK